MARLSDLVFSFAFLFFGGASAPTTPLKEGPGRSVTDGGPDVAKRGWGASEPGERSGGWRDSANGAKRTQPAVRVGGKWPNRLTRPQRSLIKLGRIYRNPQRCPWWVPVPVWVVSAVSFLVGSRRWRFGKKERAAAACRARRSGLERRLTVRLGANERMAFWTRDALIGLGPRCSDCRRGRDPDSQWLVVKQNAKAKRRSRRYTSELI